MWIEKSTSKTFSNHSEIRLYFSNTSLPVVITDEALEGLGICIVNPTPVPDYDKKTQKVSQGIPSDSNGVYYQTWDIVNLTEEEIAEQEKLSKELIEQKVQELWKAADSYVSSYISGVAIGILTIGVIQQKPKAQAVSAWSSSVWAEYYVRKAQVTEESADNLDFSSFGAIPYTVPELQEEASL